MQILFLVFILLSFFLFYHFRLNEYFNKTNIDITKKMMVDYFGNWLPFIIIILYILFNFVGLPTLFFSILSGYLYGLGMGFLLAWFGMTIGIFSSFINSRYLFRDGFTKRFGNSNYVKKLDSDIQKHPFLTALITRLFFIIPYNVQNYAYGCTCVKGESYIAASAIGILPITLMNVLFGTLLSSGNIKDAGITKVMSVLSVIFTILLILLISKKILLNKLGANDKESDR